MRKLQRKAIGGLFITALLSAPAWGASAARPATWPQIVSASAFPEQVVEADRWVQAHPDVKGDALAQAVDQQPWDPSVKALTAFPSVLGNMDKNLSWTSSLGDAYYNQQQDV